MDNIQLQLILDEAYTKTFLEKIEFLVENDKNYKKSEFFKNTKIPLLELYKNFEQYKNSQNDLIDEFNDFIEGINIDIVIEKIREFINKVEDDETIVEKLNDFIDNFNVEKVSEYATQIKEELNKVSK